MIHPCIPVDGAFFEKDVLSRVSVCRDLGHITEPSLYGVINPLHHCQAAKTSLSSLSSAALFFTLLYKIYKIWWYRNGGVGLGNKKVIHRLSYCRTFTKNIPHLHSGAVRFTACFVSRGRCLWCRNKRRWYACCLNDIWTCQGHEPARACSRCQNLTPTQGTGREVVERLM